MTKRLPALASMDSYVGDVSDRTPVVKQDVLVQRLSDEPRIEPPVVEVSVWAVRDADAWLGRWRTDDASGWCEVHQMSLTAALLDAVVDAQCSVGARLVVLCGSSVVVRGLQERWPKKWAFASWRTAKGTPVKYADLWKRVRLEGIAGARYARIHGNL